MDYRRLRETLQKLRFERRMGVPELAEDAQLAKTTVYRIEDIEAEPNREIDLNTLEKLTTALGIGLAEFFARLEGREHHPQPTTPDDAPDPVQRLADALDRLVSAKTTPVAPVAGETVTIRVPGPLREGGIHALEQAAARLVERPASRARGHSAPRRPRAATEKRKKQA